MKVCARVRFPIQAPFFFDPSALFIPSTGTLSRGASNLSEHLGFRLHSRSGWLDRVFPGPGAVLFQSQVARMEAMTCTFRLPSVLSCKLCARKVGHELSEPGIPIYSQRCFCCQRGNGTQHTENRGDARWWHSGARMLAEYSPTTMHDLIGVNAVMFDPDLCKLSAKVTSPRSTNGRKFLAV